MKNIETDPDGWYLQHSLIILPGMMSFWVYCAWKPSKRNRSGGDQYYKIKSRLAIQKITHSEAIIKQSQVTIAIRYARLNNYSACLHSGERINSGKL
jgi:hypothetical protein